MKDHLPNRSILSPALRCSAVLVPALSLFALYALFKHRNTSSGWGFLAAGAVYIHLGFYYWRRSFGLEARFFYARTVPDPDASGGVMTDGILLAGGWIGLALLGSYVF